MSGLHIHTLGVKGNPAGSVFLFGAARHQFDLPLRGPLRVAHYAQRHLHVDLRASASCSSALHPPAGAATLDSKLSEYFGSESTVTPLADSEKVPERRAETDLRPV